MGEKQEIGGTGMKIDEPTDETQLKSALATKAQKIGELAIAFADAAITAREDGDQVRALFFVIKAGECLRLARLLDLIDEHMQ
jgi:hypothetical protein